MGWKLILLLEKFTHATTKYNYQCMITYAYSVCNWSHHQINTGYCLICSLDTSSTHHVARNTCVLRSELLAFRMYCMLN